MASEISRQTKSQTTHTDQRTSSIEKWIRERARKREEEAEGKVLISSDPGSLRWPVGGARLWGIGAEGPEHHNFLLRMSVRKGHAMFVWAAAYFLSQSVSLPFFPPSLSISYYISMFSICPKSWNNVISFQRANTIFFFICFSNLTTKSCIHEVLSNMYKSVQPQSQELWCMQLWPWYDCSCQIHFYHKQLQLVGLWHHFVQRFIKNDCQNTNIQWKPFPSLKSNFLFQHLDHKFLLMMKTMSWKYKK